MYRIYTIFGSKKTKWAITNTSLIRVALLIAALELAVSIAWVLLTSPQSHTIVSSTITHRGCAAAPGKEGVYKAFEYAMLCVNAVLILVCVVLSFKTRGAYDRFAESKSITVAVCIVSVTVIFGIPITVAVSSSNDPSNSEQAQSTRVSDFIRAMIYI
ncbi:hypothetical protein HK104_007918, partial [Borealophlyctis nickersoniae]